MTDVVYKVVREYGDIMRSVVVGNDYYVGCTYNIGEITLPVLRETPIYAFGTKLYARAFMGNTIHSAILECEYEPFTDKYGGLVTPRGVYPTSRGIKQYWSEYHSGEVVNESIFFCLPTGTILCKWVKPIRKV